MGGGIESGQQMIPGQQYTFRLGVHYGASLNVLYYYLTGSSIGQLYQALQQLAYVNNANIIGDTSLGTMEDATVSFTYVGDGSDIVGNVADDIVTAFDNATEPVWHFVEANTFGNDPNVTPTPNNPWNGLIPQGVGSTILWTLGAIILISIVVFAHEAGKQV